MIAEQATDPTFGDRAATWSYETFGPLLRAVLRPFADLLTTFEPWAWRASACALILAGALWTLFLPREQIFAGCTTPRWWRDLRLWVVVVILPYLAIYLFV